MFQEFPTTRRTITLVSSILISLSAGTNYAFSIYSPQLGQQLALSSTALNVVGLAGNLGMYLSSPFGGRIIDRRGPILPLFCAAVMLAAGYGLLWLIFTHPNFSGSAAPLAMLGTLLTGVGSSLAHSSAAGGVARAFDPDRRATAIGAVLAGFGLSAFFWTTFGQLVAKGNTASLLALLSIGPASSILLGTCGYLLVVPGFDLAGRSELPYGTEPSERWRGATGDEAARLLPSPSGEQVSGWALAKEKDFWILWTMMGCCCGTALMTINNIGTIVATLYEQAGFELSERGMREFQANAVSVLSIFNCVGRVFAGAISDGLEGRYGLGRVWWLCWISTIFLLSQVLGLGVIEQLDQVPFLAGLVGFAYGNIYGTAPALVLDWFGLQHFATNFGFLNLAPLITGQIFNLSFGWIYDSHLSHSRRGKLLVCQEGRACYQSAFKVTIGACALALTLSLLAGLRRPGVSASRAKQADNSSDTEDEDSPPIRGSSSAEI